MSVTRTSYADWWVREVPWCLTASGQCRRRRAAEASFNACRVPAGRQSNGWDCRWHAIMHAPSLAEEATDQKKRAGLQLGMPKVGCMQPRWR